MTKKRSQRIDAVRAWSRRLRAILGVILVAVPALALAAFGAGVVFGGQYHFGISDPVDLSSMPVEGLAVVALATTVGLVVHLLPLHFLRRLFGQWAEGEVLTRATAASVRATGWSLLLAAAIAAVLTPVTGALLAVAGAIPAFRFSLELELGVLLGGGVTLLVGMVLDEAARIAEDAELTV